MSRRRRVLVLMVLLAGLSAYAQDPSMASPDHMFSGGSAVLWHVDFSGLNAALGFASYPELPPDVPLIGETTAVGFVDGPRVGLTALKGATTSSRGERSARLSFTLGAGVLEWGTLTEAGRQVALGVVVGGGFATLTLVDHAPSSFEDALAVPARAELDRWLYVLGPSLVSYGKVLPGVTLRLHVGYLFAFGGTWKADGIAVGDSTTPFAGPSAEVSVMVNLEEILADLLAAPDVPASSSVQEGQGEELED